MSHNMSDNINSFNTTNYIVSNYSTVADERSEISAWLSPLEPQRRHGDIRTRRIDEVGDWLLQTEAYRNWFGGISVVHEPARAESSPRLEPARRVASWTRGSSLQETAKKLPRGSSRQGARVGS